MLSLVPGEIQYKQKWNTRCWGLTGEVRILQFGERVIRLDLSSSPPTRRTTYEVLVHGGLEEKEEDFCLSAGNLIFMERGQLLCAGSAEALSHEAGSCVPRQRQLFWGRAHPQSCLQPIHGCQLGRSSSAARTNVQKTSGCDPHVSVTVPEIINHPLMQEWVCCTACVRKCLPERWKNAPSLNWKTRKKKKSPQIDLSQSVVMLKHWLYWGWWVLKCFTSLSDTLVAKEEFWGVVLSIHHVTVSKLWVNKLVKPFLFSPEEQRSGWSGSGSYGPAFHRKGKCCFP